MQAPPLLCPIRCLSVDVEEYFHIEAAHRAVPRADWDRWPSRVEHGMDTLLGLFDRLGCRATFFFLRHVAQHHPRLVQRCADLGHEIASHGSLHDRLHRLTPHQFRQETLASKRFLEDLTGRAVLGYRAPTWSLTRDTAWALDALAECGFAYDASIFPVTHPHYGIPDAPARPFIARSAPDAPRLLEIPPLTWRLMGRNLAAAGGGYFRLLPAALIRRALAQAAAEARPAVLYFHPWEFDPATPRMPLSFTSRLRTYTGLRTATERLEHLLTTTGPWRSISNHLHAMQAQAGESPVFTLTRSRPAAQCAA